MYNGEKLATTLFPAQAGVIPERREVGKMLSSFPRASGGDPKVLLVGRTTKDFSPRKRG